MAVAGLLLILLRLTWYTYPTFSFPRPYCVHSATITCVIYYIQVFLLRTLSLFKFLLCPCLSLQSQTCNRSKWIINCIDLTDFRWGTCNKGHGHSHFCQTKPLINIRGEKNETDKCTCSNACTELFYYTRQLKRSKT